MEQRRLEFDIITNDDRKFLGLDTIPEHWECRQLGKKMQVYLDENRIVRKKITLSSGNGFFNYLEERVFAETEDGGMYLKSKTGKGKGRKLTAGAVEGINLSGIYFSYKVVDDKMNVVIGSNTSCTYFYHCINAPAMSLRQWLEEWKNGTTAEDKMELAAFRKRERIIHKYGEGDIFRFKVGRRQWGFGQIMLSVSEHWGNNGDIRKYGMPNEGKPVCYTLFGYISDKKEVDVDFLMSCRRLPSHYIYDNHFLFGDYEVFDNRPVGGMCWEPVLHYGFDGDKLYLRRGLEVKLLPAYLVKKGAHPKGREYVGDIIGYHLPEYEYLEQLIEKNADFIEEIDGDDLRKPENAELKNYLMKRFGYVVKPGWKQRLMRMTTGHSLLQKMLE